MYIKITNKLDIRNPYIRKILLIMRLTAIIILVTFMHVSASSFGQNITYVEKNGTLAELFKEIKAQTGYHVIWFENHLNVDQRITTNFKNIPLTNVLDQVFKGLPVTYTINDKTVVIQHKASTFLEKVISKLTSIDVKGIVKGEDNLPLLGATVKVKGTNRLTNTDINGAFSIRGVDENAILEISYIGYETKEVKASENLGVITLMTSSSGLKEIEINAGYYKVKERELTGSISRVTAETIEKQPISNPLQALQGRVPGVEITQLTGVPGGGFKVQIRGRNSIAGGNDPLYIIDGVIYPSVRINNTNSNTITQDASPLSLINPNDIESIEVLKDADATAIYGSRGANGVILIGTKKGSVGKTKISASISQGIGQVGHRLDLMDTQQYVAMRMEAFKNDGLTPSETDYDVNGTWDKNKYTDWQKELIGGTANITSASTNVSGGTDKMNYLLSGSYYSEGTVFPGDFGFKRGSLNSTLNFGSAESRFHFTLSTIYSHTTSNLMSSDPTLYITFAPNAPDPYNQYGNLNWAYNGTTIYTNPMAGLVNTLNANTDNLIGNANVNYRIVKGLVLSASVGYTTIKRDELAKRPLIGQAPAFNPTSNNRTSQFGNNYNNSWIAEPQLTYNLQLGPGKLDALIGTSFQQNTLEYRNIQAAGFNGDDLMDNISSASIFSIKESTYTKYKYSAAYARINYSLFNKYYLNLTGRRDGSSRFGPGKQFANFGAIGAAWIFSEESLIKENLPFLSFGKLRASYGLTGNDQIPDYGFLQLYNSSPSYQGTPTLTTSRIANNNYSWETNKKAEIGVQLGFLNDKINVKINYFRNRSSNQLVGLPIPPSVGSGSIQANLPATVQNTGWEFDANFQLVNRNNWSWSLNANLTIPKNKLVSYPGLETSANAIAYILGQPLSLRRYYDSSVDSNTGFYTFVDKNGNGVRDNPDIYLSKFIGQIFYGAIENNVRYKGFNLSFLFSFSKQNGYSYLNGLLYSPGYFDYFFPTANQPVKVLNRWQNPGDNTSMQKFSTTFDSFDNFSTATTQGSQSFADDSYVRLKTLSLSYRFPKSLTSKLKMQALEMNLQGQNIFTITKYAGLDPEGQLLARLPALRVFSLGLKFTL